MVTKEENSVDAKDYAASTISRFIDFAKENKRIVEKRSRYNHHCQEKWKNIEQK